MHISHTHKYTYIHVTNLALVLVEVQQPEALDSVGHEGDLEALAAYWEIESANLVRIKNNHHHDHAHYPRHHTP